VYRGSLSGGPYTKVNSALISATSFFDADVASGQIYYYVATEVDSTGTESVYSSEVIAAIP
jgi:fibronectin type 3 domain-containing protein